MTRNQITTSRNASSRNDYHTSTKRLRVDWHSSRRTNISLLIFAYGFLVCYVNQQNTSNGTGPLREHMEAGCEPDILFGHVAPCLNTECFYSRFDKSYLVVLSRVRVQMPEARLPGCHWWQTSTTPTIASQPLQTPVPPAIQTMTYAWRFTKGRLVGSFLCLSGRS